MNGSVDMSVQDALLLIPYSVYIVTTGGESKQMGAFTASWLMQVSFEPLLLAVGVDKTSHSQALLAENGVFAVNFLGGARLLDEALAHVECEVSETLDPGGDHLIYIGKVIGGGVQRREPPLTLEQSGLRYR